MISLEDALSAGEMIKLLLLFNPLI